MIYDTNDLIKQSFGFFKNLFPRRLLNELASSCRYASS